jgi:nucleoside-diphosphate-sugar epimerase
MLRIDLVVNNLLACAHAKGEIRIMSDGSPWRPLVHCSDIAKAFVELAKAEENTVFNKAINIGSNKENYQVKDVAAIVKQLVPASNIIFTGEVGDDPRNYRVNFDLLTDILPDFKLDYTLEKGMVELNKYFIEKKFNSNDFDGDRYTRLRTLKNRLNLLKLS